MAERSAVRMPMSLEHANEFLILGNYQQCAEKLAWCRDVAGLTRIALFFHNLPDSLSGRLEYLQGFGEEVIRKLA